MKKKTKERNFKKVSIICIIALLVSLSTQFITCWNFDGITENIETGETRVVKMDMSLASYVWFPMSDEGGEFTKYVADPSLRYVEKYTSLMLYEEEVKAITDALVEKQLISAPVEEKEKKVYKDAYSTYYGTLIEVKEHHVDLFDKKSNTVMSKLDPNGMVVTAYNKFVADITDEFSYNAYINKLVIFPAILFIGALAAIAYILLVSIKKKQNLLAPSIFTLIIGVLNIVNLFVLPLFLLTTVKTFIVLGVIYVLVTLVGLIALIGDAKALKAE